MRPAIAQLLNNSPCLMRREEIRAGQKATREALLMMEAAKHFCFFFSPSRKVV